MKIRDERRAAGLCTTCGACPPREERLQCESCVDRINRARRVRAGWVLRPDGRDATLAKIGEVVGGVTRERVRQLQARALRKLRSPAHRTRVERDLRLAVRELRRIRAAGRPLAEEYAAALAVENLTMALEWLDLHALGELPSELDHADNIWDALGRCA